MEIAGGVKISVGVFGGEGNLVAGMIIGNDAVAARVNVRKNFLDKGSAVSKVIGEVAA